MGNEDTRTGGDVLDDIDGVDESVTDSTLSGGTKIQPLSTSGESGQEGSNGSVVISREPSEPGITQTLDSSGLGWSIIQLTDAAEVVPVSDVERDLRRHVIEEVLMYFPAKTKQGTFSKDNPYANYVFMSTDLPDPKLLKIEGSRFVDSVLCIPGSAGRWRTVYKLTDAEVRSTLGIPDFDELQLGTPVVITLGQWAGLEGNLVGVFGNKAKVEVGMRSRKRIINVGREEISQA